MISLVFFIDLADEWEQIILQQASSKESAKSYLLAISSLSEVICSHVSRTVWWRGVFFTVPWHSVALDQLLGQDPGGHWCIAKTEVSGKLVGALKAGDDGTFQGEEKSFSCSE